MDLAEEDKRWLTTRDQESHIHVVPLWSVASFKRMGSISRHYHVFSVLFFSLTNSLILADNLISWGMGQCVQFKFHNIRSLSDSSTFLTVSLSAEPGKSHYNAVSYSIFQGRYNSIVAFSPIGWSFGKDKKRVQGRPGRRYQQGSIIRYIVAP